MTVDLTIKGAPYASVWLFHFQGNAETLDGLSNLDICHAVGLSTEVDPRYLDRCDLDVLQEVGLSSYLRKGLGIIIDKDQAAKLDALEGTAILIFAKGISDGDTAFSNSDLFKPIGHFAPETPLPSTDPLAHEDNQTMSSKAPVSDARMSGMVATFVLIFLAAFVALFVWIA